MQSYWDLFVWGTCSPIVLTSHGVWSAGSDLFCCGGYMYSSWLFPDVSLKTIEFSPDRRCISLESRHRRWSWTLDQDVAPYFQYLWITGMGKLVKAVNTSVKNRIFLLNNEQGGNWKHGHCLSSFLAILDSHSVHSLFNITYRSLFLFFCGLNRS